VRDIELETTSFEVGGDAEVFKVAEASRHALSELKDTVDCLHGGVGQAGCRCCMAREALFSPNRGVEESSVVPVRAKNCSRAAELLF